MGQLQVSVEIKIGRRVKEMQKASDFRQARVSQTVDLSLLLFTHSVRSGSDSVLNRSLIDLNIGFSQINVITWCAIIPRAIVVGLRVCSAEVLEGIVM